MDQLSPAQLLSSMPEAERLSLLQKLSTEDKAYLRYHWPFHARPDQLSPEGLWNTWLILAGRGFGKTRMGAEWVRQVANEYPGCRIALVGETAADVRDVMILGESGIIACDPLLDADSWSPTNRRLTWPNGSTAWAYNATEPDQLRGPQHHFAWLDELAKFRYMQETWDQCQFGLRLGEHPKAIVTTTPRPLPLIKKLLVDQDTYVTRGSTFDNKDNLARPFIKQIEDRYGGTRLGRQELEGEILDDIPGALWSRTAIDDNRRERPEDLERVVVAVDPSTSSADGADETGIVCVGLGRDNDGYARGYVLADRSLRGTPEEWAKAAVRLYRENQADYIVAEKNQGGEMVTAVIKAIDRSVPVRLVHASRGKIIRAEPISALYEQSRVHHCGRFDKLEDQMCTFSVDNIRANGFGSPDRVDALVWGLTELFDKITARRRPKDDTQVSKLPEVRQAYDAQSYSKASSTSWMAG